MDNRMMEILRENQVDLKNFDHFQYLSAIEDLDEELLHLNPHKRNIINEFIEKCERMALREERKENGRTWENFLKRMKIQETFRKQKIQAMSFIKDHYDQKAEQLLFYPKLSKRKATQRNRYWKDIDEPIQEQASIQVPNESALDFL